MPVTSLRRVRRAACALSILMVGCSPISPYRRTDDDKAGPPTATFAAITRPIDGRGTREQQLLEDQADHPGSILRICYIRQHNGDFAGTTTPLNRLIHGDGAPGDEVLAIARWLRARAQKHVGDERAASSDLDRAQHLTTDPRLLAAIAADRPAPTIPIETSVRGALGPLAIENRKAWGAAPENPARLSPMGPITRLTVHHSATIAQTGRSTTIASLRAIQTEQQRGRQWGDIGYHFLVDPDGRVWEGRRIRWQGAHAGDSERNKGNVGICLLGSYIPKEQGAPPPRQVEALERLIVTLCDQHSIPAEGVHTHRELKEQTECPGPYLQTAVARFRSRLDGAGLSAGPTIPAKRSRPAE